MKKFLTILTAGIVLCNLPAFHFTTSAAPLTGKCGDNITFTLDRGILTLTGSGATDDYDPTEYDDEEYLERLENSPNPEEEEPIYTALPPWEDSMYPIYEVYVGEGITRIGNYFCSNKQLQKLELPDTLLEIGDNAFLNSYLNTLTIPDSVTSIGDSAFDGCKELRKLTLSESLETIGNYAFSCGKFINLTLPPHVRTIGRGAFQLCEIQTAVLTDSVEEIGERCFADCPALEYVRLSASCRELPKSCFIRDQALKEISIPGTTKKIDDFCFQNCNALKYVNLGEGVQMIGTEAFSGCLNLERIQFPESLEKLGQRAFCTCNLVNLTIPPNLTELANYAFECNALTSVTIPKTVEKIGTGCFSENFNLKSAVFLCSDFQDSMLCFAGCDALTYVRLPAECSYLPSGFLSNCTALRQIDIPRSCRVLGSSCFEGCTALEPFALPDSIEIIESDAFNGCRNLTRLHLPKKLTRIESKAFANTPLREIHLPDSVQFIGKDAFESCNDLQVFTMPERYIRMEDNALPEQWLEQQGDFVIVGDGQLYQYRGTDQHIQVPGGIKTVMHKAFDPKRGCNPTGITFSSTVRSIEDAAIVNCTALEELEIPDSVTYIDNTAVKNCPALKTVRGELYSAAYDLAVRTKLTFEQLHPEDLGTPVFPQTDTENFSFGNDSSLFGEQYRLSAWKQAMLCDATTTPHYMSGYFGNKWSGSCFGIAAVTILVRNGLLPLSALDPEAGTLHDVRPTAQVQEYINLYHFTQYISDSEMKKRNITQFQHLVSAASCARRVNHGASPFILKLILKNDTGHAVVGYGLEAGEWEWDGERYDRRILIWDSNFSVTDDKVNLYFDKESLHWNLPAYGIRFSKDSSADSGCIAGVIQDPAEIACLPDPCSEPLPGDVNRDAALTAADAVLLARYSAEDADLSYTGTINADADGSGTVTMHDVFTVLRRIAAAPA